MKKFLTSFAVMLSLLPTFGQSKEYSGLIIDPSIKAKAEEHFSELEEGAGLPGLAGFVIYNNSMLIDLYEDDKLVLSSQDQAQKRIFKSFYYRMGDTIGIDGAFGLFGGTGFSIRLCNGKADVYHLLASDELPSYAYTPNDSLVFRLEVPCTESRIILSEVPGSSKNKVIYGYVEFKSADYYSGSCNEEGEETQERKKHRADMNIYFKSARLDL